MAAFQITVMHSTVGPIEKERSLPKSEI